MRPLVVWGAEDVGGTYVLRMVVNRSVRVRFGRFGGGRQIAVVPGVYVYVGSAMGTVQTLGRRLARHASRSGRKKPQDLRDEVVDVFGNVLPKGPKRLRWHVDFLLDRAVVDLTHAVAIRSAVRLEEKVAGILAADPQAGILAAGLGASDAPGHTHLMCVPDALGWWTAFVTRLQTDF